MKCEDILIFVCICMCQLAGSISYSIANPIYPLEVGILYFNIYIWITDLITEVMEKKPSQT